LLIVQDVVFPDSNPKFGGATGVLLGVVVAVCPAVKGTVEYVALA
jgi:hypothetical protein